MSKKSIYYYTFLITFSLLLPKWIVTLIQVESSVFVNVLENINDDHYFPIVISFSNFDFSPTYIENIKDAKILSFPLFGIFFHALFFKFFGVYSFPILEFIFQFLSLFILFNLVNRITNNINHTIFFGISIYLLILSLKFIFYSFDYSFLDPLYITLEDNFGTRFPRPLITSIFLFSFLLILFNFKKKLEDFNFKYFFLLILLLAAFLNSFFYYFVNFSVLLIILFLIYKKDNFLKFVTNHLYKLIILIILFCVFSLPFALQSYFGEFDYMERIGMISPNYDQRFTLVQYYLKSLFKIKFLSLIILAIISHTFINSIYYRGKIKKNNLNIIFYFILSSILGPLLFFLISPKLISIYHFLGVLVFSLIFFIILSIYCIVLSFLEFISINFRPNYFLPFFLICYFLVNIYSEYSLFKIKKDEIIELNQIQEFLEKNRFQYSKNKLFTNNIKIMNLWLLNKNSELVISDGFTNSLKNDEIEFNLINNLKFFKTSKDEFQNMLSYGESKNRIYFFIRLFIYRYQANSLFTYSSLENYSENYRNTIKKISPFRAQSQVIPEDEKKRFLDLFDNINLQEEFLSNVVIIKKEGVFEKFIVNNKDFNNIFKTQNYDVYQLIE